MYDTICLGPNIELQASQPLYPECHFHPHKKYAGCELLKIDFLSSEMKRLNNKINIKFGKQIQKQHKNWLDFLKVADLEGNCTKKIGYEQILGKNNPTTLDEVMMYNHCKHSIYAAAKRQMKKAPKPDEKIAEDFVKFAIDIIDGKGPGLLKNEQLNRELNEFQYSFNQWYNHNTLTKQHDIDRYLQYAGQKPTRAEFTEKQIEDLESTTYKGICKQELQPTNGKSRMVCSIPIKTKVTMGPVTWKLEEIMAKHFPGYCGNKNLQEMSNAINHILQLGFTKIVEGDGSAFDNTQDVSLKEVDRYLYRKIADKIYHVPKAQFLEISQQLYKTMSVEYINHKKQKKTLLTYSILGSVFSGDCDTTLCNTMRMALYNIYVNEKAGFRYGIDYLLFSKGDDFTVFYKPNIKDDDIRSAYYKYFIKGSAVETTETYGLGQVLKFMTIGPPNTISFCSLRAFYRNNAENSIILVRDFKKFWDIAKYARKIKILTGKQRIAYLLQQAIALRVTYRGINVFNIMAQAYEQEAYSYACYFANGIRNKITSIMKQSFKIANREINKNRKQECEFLQFNKIDHMLYDIGYKHIENFKLREGMGYWETVKYMQQKCDYNLNKNELQYINQQIEAEIDTQEFKTTMGLKNESY